MYLRLSSRLQVGGREDSCVHVCMFPDRLGDIYEWWGQGWQSGQLGVCQVFVGGCGGGQEKIAHRRGCVPLLRGTCSMEKWILRVIAMFAD